MYYYVYDNYLLEKKYQNTISKIESRLVDLGINGKIIKLNNSLPNKLKEELNNIKTLVVVGNDKTLNQTINLIKNFNKTIGFIPIGDDNNFCKLIGVPENEGACDILSSRIIKTINLGTINNSIDFLTYLEIPTYNIYLNCDDNFYINTDDKNGIITISNLYYGEYEKNIKIDNNSKKLNIIIKNQKKQFLRLKKDFFSRFQAKKIAISSDKSIPILLIDEKRIIKTPATITIGEKKINLIVGKNRLI